MALDLVDFDEVKHLLGLTKAEDQYPALEILEKQVAASVEGFLGRELTQKERTEEITLPRPTRMVGLKGLPVVTVSSVSLLCFGDTTTYTSAEYMAVSYGLQLLAAAGPGVLSVTYTGGMKNNAIPDIIKQAATLQLAYEFQNKDHIGAESISTEGGTKQIPELRLLGKVKDMLRRERHPLKIS